MEEDRKRMREERESMMRDMDDYEDSFSRDMEEL